MGKARKPLVALFVALVAFFVFVGATRFYINQNVELLSVVAAAEPVPPRTRIEASKLKITHIPKGYAPKDFAPTVDIFVNESYFTGEIGLNAGEILTRSKVFTDENIAHSHTLTLAPDETILGISTDLVRSAGASVYPGSRVRALAYVAPRQDSWQNTSDSSRVEVIFDNLRVVGTVNTEANDTSTQEQRGRVPSVIKIAVTHEQERVLIRYQEEHRVWFTVLPENYKPDPKLEDFFKRAAQLPDPITKEDPKESEPGLIRSFN